MPNCLLNLTKEVTMSSERQMKRGKAQALYKYLPDSWIDFSVRGKDRKQYIAKVDHILH